MKNFFRLQTLAAIAALLLLTDADDAIARQRGPIAPGETPADTASIAAAAGAPRAPEVRVVYFSGDVSLVDTAGPLAISFGRSIDSIHTVVVARGGSVQLAVDGRLVEITRPGKIRRAEIIRRAKGEPNEELMAALRAIDVHADAVSSSAVGPAKMEAALVAALAPSSRAVGASATGEIVPLEPRSTGVTRGPLRFRWLRSADSATYRVVVRDRFDVEVLRTETTDTTFVWESAVLFAGSEYTWTIADVRDTSDVATATFHRLDDLRGMRLEGGESRIRLALGSENPALPLMLGAHFALHGCYGDAVRQFTTAALRTPEHFDRFLRLARTLYATNIGLTATELEHVQTLGAISMN